MTSARYPDTAGGESFGDVVLSKWDRFVYGGLTLPGVATVEGFRRMKIDKRSAPGTDGSTLTQIGNDPAEVTVRLRLWTPEQFDKFTQYVPQLLASIGKTRSKPVMVYHPALNLLGIHKLLATDVHTPVVQPGGIIEVEIKLIEFIPANKTGVVTPKAAINTEIPNAVTGWNVDRWGSGWKKPPSAKVPGP